MTNTMPSFDSKDMLFAQQEWLKSLTTHLMATGIVSVLSMQVMCTDAANKADKIAVGPKPLKAGAYLRHIFDRFPWEAWKQAELARQQKRN